MVARYVCAVRSCIYRYIVITYNIAWSISTYIVFYIEHVHRVVANASIHLLASANPKMAMATCSKMQPRNDYSSTIGFDASTRQSAARTNAAARRRVSRRSLSLSCFCLMQGWEATGESTREESRILPSPFPRLTSPLCLESVRSAILLLLLVFLFFLFFLLFINSSLTIFQSYSQHHGHAPSICCCPPALRSPE